MWDVPRVVQKRRTMTDCAGSGVNFAISEKKRWQVAQAQYSTSLGGSVIKNVAVLVMSKRPSHEGLVICRPSWTKVPPSGRAGANHKLEGTITQNEDLFSGGRENVCLLYDLHLARVLVH